MNAAFILFVLLMLACAALALASFFTPRFTPFKQRTKLKSFGFWLGMAFVCLVAAGSIAPEQPKKEEPQAVASPLPPELTKERTSEEQSADRARMVEKTTAAQAELKTLYSELLAMRGTREFAELGYSAKNRPAADWQAKVNALRDLMDKDLDIAVEVRAAPGYLLGLGLDKTWRAGGMTDKAKWDEGMVREALNWKMPE